MNRSGCVCAWKNYRINTSELVNLQLFCTWVKPHILTALLAVWLEAEGLPTFRNSSAQRWYIRTWREEPKELERHLPAGLLKESFPSGGRKHTERRFGIQHGLAPGRLPEGQGIEGLWEMVHARQQSLASTASCCWMETDSACYSWPCECHTWSLVQPHWTLPSVPIFSILGNIIESSVVGGLAVLAHVFLRIFVISGTHEARVCFLFSGSAMVMLPWGNRAWFPSVQQQEARGGTHQKTQLIHQSIFPTRYQNKELGKRHLASCLLGREKQSKKAVS